MQPTLKITRLTLQPTGGYAQQYRRPYRAQLTQRVADAFVRVFKPNGNPRNWEELPLVPIQLTGVASGFVKLARQPEDAVAIEGGWEAPRLAFELEVESEFPGLPSKRTWLLCGYTEVCEFAGDLSSIDSSLRFFLNSCVSLGETPIEGSSEQAAQQRVISASHVLYDPHWKGIYHPTVMARMRPEEIFATISRLDAQLGDATDMRAALTSVPVLSDVRHGVPMLYLQRLLESYFAAQVARDPDSSQQEMLAFARGMAADVSAAQNPFLAALAMSTNGRLTAEFTLGHLGELGLKEESVAVRQQPVFGELLQDDSGLSQNASDEQTAIAATLATAVPALLRNCGLKAVDFYASNRTPQGLVQGAVINAVERISGVNGDAAVVFAEQLNNYVLRDLSEFNATTYALKVTCQTALKTRLEISWGNNAAAVYVYPTFADALCSPLIAQQESTLLALAREVDYLVTMDLQ